MRAMKKISLVLFMIAANGLSAQMLMMGGDEFEIGGVNYSNVPNLGDTEVTNFGADGGLARPFGKGFLGIRINYQNFDFSFNESTNIIDFSTYENMNLVQANVFYRRPLKNSWSMTISFGSSLISNLEGDISTEDFVINTIGLLSKKWGDRGRHSVLSFGALYGTQFGQPTLLPVVSFRQKLNEQWSYSIGLPITGINYKINKKNRLSFTLQPQGIYGNNSGEVLFESGTLTNSKLQYNALRTGISYRYKILPFLSALVEGGYLPLVNLRILDKDNNEIYDFNPDSSAYFNVGLRFGIDMKKSNSKNDSDEN